MEEVHHVEEEESLVDYTKIPSELEQQFEKLDENNALRPTIINLDDTWSKTFQKTLLSEPQTKSVLTEVCKTMLFE